MGYSEALLTGVFKTQDIGFDITSLTSDIRELLP